MSRRDVLQFAVFIIVVVVAILAVAAIEREAAQTLYRNQITSCESGNVVRFVVHDFATAATQARTESAKDDPSPAARQTDLLAAARYHRDAKRLERVPFGMPNGERDCLRAIKRP